MFFFNANQKAIISKTKRPKSPTISVRICLDEGGKVSDFEERRKMIVLQLQDLYTTM